MVRLSEALHRCLALLFAVCLSALAQLPPDTPGAAASSDTTAAPPAVASTNEKNYYAEVGGFFNHLDNNYGDWKGLDAKFGFTGNKHFAPFFTFSSQTRDQGTQQNYGMYSYVTFSKRFWAIVGASGAPERSAILYPKLRVDGTLFSGVPGVPGLFISTGFSDFHMPDGGGGVIGSLGTIYYHRKLIVSGSFNINSSRPGGIISQSGQAGFQYGSQGKSWFGAGMSGGKLAYQVINLTPFDVRFNTIGVNMFYQRWITRKWGLTWRAEYQNEIDAFHRYGASMATFFEF